MSALRCRPGDLARITANSRHVVGLTQDAIVSVLHAPEIDADGFCVLPDGHRSCVSNSDWVIEFFGPILIKQNDMSLRSTCFAVCADKYLRPIRHPGDEATDETLLWLPAPKQTEAA